MTTRVALVSTHRADRGHYAPLGRLLRSDRRFEVCPPETVRTRTSLPDVDVAVVLGDRYEMLLAAAAFVEARIPLLHIHGGEHTYGSLDERWRWAMSVMADVHCVATNDAQTQIACLDLATRNPRGEPLRIVVTGAPGLDGIRERKPEKVANDTIVLYNPAMDRETTILEANAIEEATRTTGELWIKPNGDRYSDKITHGMADLPHERFRDFLAGARVIVGNSSAGIIEAPSLGTWAVNIGQRQAGRVRAGNVIDVPADAAAIRAAIKDALSRPRYSGGNPYEHPQGKACEAIRDVLLGMGVESA